MKIREAIAQVFWSKWEEYCGRSWNSLEDSIKQEWIEWVDQLFAIREDGCRLAIVKEERELPDFPIPVDLGDNLVGWRTAGDSEKDFIKLLEDKAHYVQEKVDD